MSYILDALKKIEQEKSKKGSNGRASISGDLFMSRERPSTAKLWKVMVLVATAASVACVATWFALRSGRSDVKVVPAKPVATQSAPAVNIPVAAVAQPKPSPVSVQLAPQAKPSIGKIQELDGEDPPHNKEQTMKTKKMPQPITSKQPTQLVPAPADIKLSGIAWQDERSARRAVINGFLLKEGAIVSGTTITDIQADRVRFSSAAGTFEIRLDAVFPSEVKR